MEQTEIADCGALGYGRGRGRGRVVDAVELLRLCARELRTWKRNADNLLSTKRGIDESNQDCHMLIDVPRAIFIVAWLTISLFSLLVYWVPIENVLAFDCPTLLYS